MRNRAPNFPEIIDVEFIKVFNEYIRSVSDDTEIAHSYEDLLYFCVLESIAENKCKDPIMCSKEALKSSNIQFQRWCS
jgi:hypothetical protein